MDRTARVYGESADDILRVLSRTHCDIAEDGMYEFDICLTPEEAGPVGRAMMRAEARLLREDADHAGPLAKDMRTPEQRRADALFAVVSDAAAALGLPPAKGRPG